MQDRCGYQALKSTGEQVGEQAGEAENHKHAEGKPPKPRIKCGKIRLDKDGADFFATVEYRKKYRKMFKREAVVLSFQQGAPGQFFADRIGRGKTFRIVDVVGEGLEVTIEEIRVFDGGMGGQADQVTIRCFPVSEHKTVAGVLPHHVGQGRKFTEQGLLVENNFVIDKSG